jgi:hypothetical protein
VRIGGPSERPIPSTEFDVHMVAVIHLLCQTNPSFATAVVNGLLASASVLAGCMAFWSGVPAGMSLFVEATPEMRTDAISRGMGIGFMWGLPLGALTLFVFAARLVS